MSRWGAARRRRRRLCSRNEQRRDGAPTGGASSPIKAEGCHGSILACSIWRNADRRRRAAFIGQWPRRRHGGIAGRLLAGRRSAGNGTFVVGLLFGPLVLAALRSSLPGMTLGRAMALGRACRSARRVWHSGGIGMYVEARHYRRCPVFTALDCRDGRVPVRHGHGSGCAGLGAPSGKANGPTDRGRATSLSCSLSMTAAASCRRGLQLVGQSLRPAHISNPSPNREQSSVIVLWSGVNLHVKALRGIR